MIDRAHPSRASLVKDADGSPRPRCRWMHPYSVTGCQSAPDERVFSHGDWMPHVLAELSAVEWRSQAELRARGLPSWAVTVCLAFLEVGGLVDRKGEWYDGPVLFRLHAS